MDRIAFETAIIALAPGERFFRENATILGIAICATLALLAIRLAIKGTTRVVVLVLLAATAIFIVVEQDEIEACATTCSCRLAGQDVRLGVCPAGLTDLGQ